ncbi:FAD-binding protein [Apiospora rasikravindrae]|uniref:FAD-binding protein n=1 Tax=Apiospora rasikravindrae TaxID=990691 RepID=A0ABR1SJ00_9PEZI
MSSVSESIEAVKKLSSAPVHLPGSQDYEELTSSYFSELERELRPACFLTPRSAQEVADILKATKPFVGPSEVAICGAGQQATPGVANVLDGLTIHLRGLRGIEIDKERNVVSIAAGERMGAVYDAVVAEGLGVVGNRHSSGGIGGHALQGGLSYFSYARGFICDDVINYEVVLADGDIVNANAENNRELWIALKGGGNNFGIVTRFDLNVFEQGPMWGGKVFYFQPCFSSQIKSLVEYLQEPEPDNSVHICLSLGYAAALGDIVCMNDVFCSRPAKPEALEPFTDIQPQIDQMNSLGVNSLRELADEEFSGAVPNRVVKMSTTVKADFGILEYAVALFRTSFEKLRNVSNILFSMTFEPLPLPMMEQSISRGGNSLGLDPAHGPLVVVMFYTSWDQPEDDEVVSSVSKEALERIDIEAQSRGVSAQYRYLNYALPHQDPLGSYGPENNARLQAVSAKYDPERFFQKAGVGPFKLS